MGRHWGSGSLLVPARQRAEGWRTLGLFVLRRGRHHQLLRHLYGLRRVGGYPKLIETADFTTFNISTLSGVCARGKGMALFPAGSGEISWRWHGPTTRAPSCSGPTACSAGRRRTGARSHRAMGDRAGGELWLPDGDAGRLAGAHARSRPDAPVGVVGGPPRPGRADESHRTAPRTTPRARVLGARRVRAQRGVLLRGPDPPRPARCSLRHLGLMDLGGDGAGL